MQVRPRRAVSALVVPGGPGGSRSPRGRQEEKDGSIRGAGGLFMRFRLYHSGPGAGAVQEQGLRKGSDCPVPPAPPPWFSISSWPLAPACGEVWLCSIMEPLLGVGHLGSLCPRAPSCLGWVGQPPFDASSSPQAAAPLSPASPDFSGQREHHLLQEGPLDLFCMVCTQVEIDSLISLLQQQ